MTADDVLRVTRGYTDATGVGADSLHPRSRGHGRRDAATCFVQGAVCGHPAGHKSGEALRERIARRELDR